MDDKGLRQSFTIKFTSEEKCPVCDNIINIEVRNNIERNKLMGTISSHFKEHSNKMWKMYMFKEVRMYFWLSFLLMIIFSVMSMLIVNFPQINIFYFMTIVFGIIYVCSSVAYYIVKKIREKKNLKTAIDEIIKG